MREEHMNDILLGHTNETAIEKRMKGKLLYEPTMSGCYTEYIKQLIYVQSQL